jgi:hypothetical protein
MPDPDAPQSSDLDDWFSGLEDDARTRAVELPARASDDDWVRDEPARPPADERSGGLTVTLGTLLVVGAAVLVVVILVAGLAVGGVFSGGGTGGTKGTTSTPTVTTTATQPTTTASTTPATPAVSPPATTLKPGDQGVQVKRLQRALTRLGYAAGAVDGDYGTSTQAALKRFQGASKLTADGVLGPATLKALKLALQRHG